MKFHTQFQLTISKNLWKLWFWIEELCVIFLKEVSFEWNFILISAKNKHKIENFDFELKCYVSYFSWRYHLNEISYSISGNNKRKFLKLWFWIEELHVIFLKEVSFEWNFILISAKNKLLQTNLPKIKILIWNWSVMCHISQGGIIWMKFILNFN